MKIFTPSPSSFFTPSPSSSSKRTNCKRGTRERIESGAGVRLYLTRSMIMELSAGISNVHVLLILHMCYSACFMIHV